MAAVKNETAAMQIGVMGRLKQTAASWLADVPQSTLRDAANAIAPSENGTYDARAVAAWSSTRVPDEMLSDDEVETVVRAGETLAGMLTPEPAIAVRRLQVLIDKYGLKAAELILTILLTEAEELSHPPAELPPMDRTVCLCEHCGRLRRGRTWVKPKRAYAKDEIVFSECPGCKI